MRKLIGAGIFRLKTSRPFYCSLASMAAFAAILALSAYRSKVIHDFAQVTIDSRLFSAAVVLALVASVFTSLFVGAEFSDGTIRNKLIVGHGRGAIYLANLVVACLVVTLAQVVYYAVVFAISLPLLGLEMSAAQCLSLMGTMWMLSLALVSIFTLVAMLLRSKTTAAVTCMLLALALVFAGALLGSRLNEPELYEGYTMFIDGEMVQGEPTENPTYLRGAWRQVYSVLYDLCPGGQAMQLGGSSVENPFLLMLYSLGLLLLSTALGVKLFGKIDIK